MPDIVAARPASGASIESAWGGQVHDLLEGIQAGKLTVNVANTAVQGATITFPKPYASNPTLIMSCAGTYSSSSVHAFIANSGASLTPTQCGIAVGRDDGVASSGTFIVHWLAIGTLA